MASYVFDQLAPSQRQHLDPTDQVLFHGGSARLAVVAYDADAGATVSFLGHAVTFDGGLQSVAANHGLTFDDGSLLLVGGVGGDALAGGAGDDGLFGGGGSDTLDGHGGSNFLQGNQGDDRLFAGLGADTILGGQGADEIQTNTVGIGLPGEAGDLANGNLGDDTVSSGNGADTLLGGQGNDVLFGEAGADYLNGNKGDDRVAGDGAAAMFGEDGADTLTARGEGAVLTGGAGADRFVFVGGADTVTGVRATITDWSGEDAISFSHVLPAHAYAEIQAADFGAALAEAARITITSVDPARSGGEVVVAQVGGDLYAFAASIGSPTPNLVILITGRTLADIEASDFL